MKDLTEEQKEDMRQGADFYRGAPSKAMIHKLAYLLYDKNITNREKNEHWERLNKGFDRWNVESVIRDLDSLILIRTKLQDDGK